MKVRVSFMVDVDPVAWSAEYGVEGAAEIRKDVVRYVEQAVRAQFDELGVTLPA